MVLCQLVRGRRKGSECACSFRRWKLRPFTLPIGKARGDGIENDHRVMFALPDFTLGRQTDEKLWEDLYKNASDFIFGRSTEDAERLLYFFSAYETDRNPTRCGFPQNCLYYWRHGCSRFLIVSAGTFHNDCCRKAEFQERCNTLARHCNGSSIRAARRDGAGSPVQQPFRSLKQGVAKPAAACVERQNSYFVAVLHPVKSMAAGFLRSHNHSSLRAITCALRPLAVLSCNAFSISVRRSSTASRMVS